uniref:SJCHGC05100 protein n=1 Tax=Schistosoma japonicum TaxID=6182 RepID=Q5DH87_SCHJA|nr:SJCHGC05100 protein [Schistosoma japonicum]
MYNNALQSTYYKISNTDVKSTVMDTSKNKRFVVKVFVINILQIFLSILMTALVFAIETVYRFFLKYPWVAFILSLFSMVTTVAIFLIQRFTRLIALTNLSYTIFIFSFAGVITFLSVSVQGMFVFIGWMLVIILSIVLFLIGINIQRDLTRYINAFLIYTICIIDVIAVLGLVFYFLHPPVILFVIGLLAIAIVIPVSSLEAQILYGGKMIFYRPTDLILASMVHWFLTPFLYSGFIFLCVSINSLINKHSSVFSI